MLQLTGLNVQITPTLVHVDRTSIFPSLFSILDRIIHDLKSFPWTLFQSPPKEKDIPQINCLESEAATKSNNCSISKDEVKFVMEKLGLFCNNEEEEIKNCFEADDLITIFDENEPSFEELNKTFNVFDKNRDGFIDAEELHSVLGLLGSNKGIFVHDCRRMIARFDQNKDGKIDFIEFVKFMEIALS